MNLTLNDTQKKLLLETIAKAHIVEWMQGKDNSQLEELIAVIADVLKKEGKEHIFHAVFQEYRET